MLHINIYIYIFFFPRAKLFAFTFGDENSERWARAVNATEMNEQRERGEGGKKERKRVEFSTNREKNQYYPADGETWLAFVHRSIKMLERTSETVEIRWRISSTSSSPTSLLLPFPKVFKDRRSRKKKFPQARASHRYNSPLLLVDPVPDK